jgi:SHS2 domain-containing protein
VDAGESAAPVIRPVSGHRTVPHTADLRIEAWAPTVAGCFAEVVRGMVVAFADTSTTRSVAERPCAFAAASAEDLLVAVLDEVVYRLDVDGELPVDVVVDEVRVTADGWRAAVRFRMAEAVTAALVGAVPKAVSLYGLRLTEGPEGWWCRVTLDV